MNTFDQVPAYLVGKNRGNALSGMTAGLGASRGPHISLRDGKFRLVNAVGVEGPVSLTFDVIIIGANVNVSRIFYPPYDANNIRPPICFSDNGTGPSDRAMEPQSPTCNLCPQNKRGSGTTFSGQPTTACRVQKKLAVIIPNDQNPNVYELTVPPASLGALRDYHSWVERQRVPGLDRPVSEGDLITRLGWSEEKNKNFRLTFSPIGWTDERATQMTEYIDANGLMDTPLGRDDVAMDPVRVSELLARQPLQPALTFPLAAAQAPPQGFQLPPRPQEAPPPTAFTPAAPLPPATGQSAPAQPAHWWSNLQPAPGPAPAPDKRPVGRPRKPPAPPSPPQVPTQATPQPGFVTPTPPPPPADIQSALEQAMNLVPRR
jgi:hypothetical protein